MATSQPPKKEYPPLTGSFSIKTIQGTGTSAQYWKIADDLVRGSRIFKTLCIKILRAKQQNGKNTSLKLKIRAAYKELLKEFKSFERDANKILKTQELQIKKKDKLIETYRAALKKEKGVSKELRRNLTFSFNRNKILKTETAKTRVSEAFFNKSFNWHTDNMVEYKRIEIMIRGIVSFHELEIAGETNYYELLLLSIGWQMDAFSKEQVLRRFGPHLRIRFTKEINKLIKQGYIRRFERKAFYNLTEEGKKRFDELFEKVYTRKYQGFWKNIFKPTKKQL